MIPKIAWFYWEGAEMPYLRWLSILSFSTMNPEWEINIVTDENTSFNLIADELVNMDIKLIQHDLTKYKQVAHRADVSKWECLNTHGGLAIDTDILFIRPIEHANLNMNANALICLNKGKNGKSWHSVGFMLAQKDSVFKHISNYYPSDDSDYQTYGRTPLDALMREHGDSVDMFDPDIVYPYYGAKARKAYLTDSPCHVPASTVGVHWYGGHIDAQRACERITSFDDFKRSKIGLYKLFKKYIKGVGGD